LTDRWVPLGRILALLTLAALTPAALRAQVDVPKFLSENAGFSSGDLEKLAKGEAVLKVPKSEDNTEVQVFGAVMVGVPASFLIRGFRDFNAPVSDASTIMQMGRFSSTPALADLSRLEIPKDDVEALKKCQVGKCDVKLPAGAIERFLADVDWSASDYSRQVQALFAQISAEYVQAYMSEGANALATYDDKSEPLSVAEGFRRLLGESTHSLSYDAAFRRYLEGYPNEPLEGVEDIFYWAVEDFSLKPVIGLHHMAIRAEPETTGVDAIIATKQIYASHYFQAAFDYVIVVSVPGSDEAYLLWVLRQRFDGKVSGIKRTMLERGLRGNIEDMLESLKTNIEKSYKASG
jgi:hypothetical protein